MTTIKHRRGTAEQWTTANPILAAGEKGVELDTGKEKTGNGVTLWNDLPYFLPENELDEKYELKGEGGEFSGNADDITDGVVKSVTTKVERTKLAGIQAEATKNASDADLRDITKTTGSLPASRVSGLSTAISDAGGVVASGGIKQFPDVADVDPDQGDTLIWDPTEGAYVPTDPSLRFVTRGADGRLSPTDLPKYSLTGVVLNEGATVPADLPAGALVFYTTAALDLTPDLLKTGFAQSASAVTLTIDEALQVGDYILIGAGASNEATPDVLTGFQAVPSAGAFTLSWSGLSNPNVGGAIAQGLAKVTTLIPAGSTISVTPRRSDGTAINRPHIMAGIARLPNLANSSPVDQLAVGGGNSGSTMTAISAGPTSADTSQAFEVAIAMAIWNSGTGTTTRPLTANSPWVELADFESESATSARSLLIAYRILDSVTKPAFNTTMVSSDGATGQWSTNLVTYKGKVV